LKGTLARQTGSALSWQAFQFVGVKVIYFFRLIVLARLLGPDDFGLFAISMVAMDFLMALTNPGMIQALVQKNEPTRRDYDAAYTVGLIRAVLVSMPLVLTAPWIATLVSEPRATLLIQIMALRPLLESAMSVRVAELQRDLRFERLAAVQVSEACGNTVVSIATALPFGVWALAWGQLSGALALLFTSYVVAPYRPRATLQRSAVRPLIQYGRWIFLGGILSIGTSLAIRLVVTRQLSAADLGLYFLAGKLAFLAWDASNALVEKVAFPVYSRLQTNPAEAQRRFSFFLSAVFAFLIPASTVLIVVAPDLIEFVLGSRWEGTLPVIRVLAGVAMIGLFSDSAAPVLLGFGRPRGVAVVEAIQLVVLLATISPLLDRFGITGAALALFAGVAASQLAALVLLRHTLPTPFRGIPLRFATVGVATLAGGSAAWSVDTVFPGPYGALASVGVAGLLVCGLLLIGEVKLRLGFREELAGLFPALASWLKSSVS
jgi:O-antigen/teichoic acid export membrane protein